MTNLKHPWVPGPAKTTYGKDVTILTVTARRPCPIVGLVHTQDYDLLTGWTSIGEGQSTFFGTCHLAPPERPRLSGWVNVYRGYTHEGAFVSKEAADRAARGFDRIACIDLSQFYEGEGLE